VFVLPGYLRGQGGGYDTIDRPQPGRACPWGEEGVDGWPGGKRKSWRRSGEADELAVAPERRDGTLQRPRIIWVVRHGDDLYVRSVNGADGAWFRGVEVSHAGRISAGGVDADVVFEDADHDVDDDLDEEYRRKYGRSSSAVDSITSANARATTIRLLPASG